MTSAPLNCERLDPAELNEGGWLSVHVYYADDRTPLLTNCVAPLVAALRADGLIGGYYFVRHWLEGSHLRLRLRPDPARLAEVRALVEREVGDFLDREPSTYRPEQDISDELYRQRFTLEFSEQQWLHRYGDPGRMPHQEYNTLGYFDYAPETARYGGACGLRIADWHAEHSSDMVLGLLGSNNVHVRTVLLGLATQTMLALVRGCTADARESSAVFGDYLDSWAGMFHGEHERYEAAYLDMAPGLRDRVRRIEAAAAEHRVDGLPAFVGDLVAHTGELRTRLLRCVHDGALSCPETGVVVPSGDGAEWRRALSFLVRNYVHMTNNRLGVSVATENYLCYLLRRAIDDEFGT